MMRFQIRIPELFKKGTCRNRFYNTYGYSDREFMGISVKMFAKDAHWNEHWNAFETLNTRTETHRIAHDRTYRY